MTTLRTYVDVPLAAGFPFPTPGWAASADNFWHRLYITRDDSWADWRSRPVVVYFHGSGTNVAPQGENTWFVQQCLARGWVWIDSMALDAQGSNGDRPWKFPYGSLNATNLALSGNGLAWWVRSTMESAEIKAFSGPVILFGHSMGGGAVMPYLAGRTGPVSTQVKASIVNSHMTASLGSNGAMYDASRTIRYNTGLLQETDHKLLVVAGGLDDYCPQAYLRRLQVSIPPGKDIYCMTGHPNGPHGWFTNSSLGGQMHLWLDQLIKGDPVRDNTQALAIPGPVGPMPPRPAPPVEPVVAGVESFNGRDGDVLPLAGDYTVSMVGGLEAELQALSVAIGGRAPAVHTHSTAQVAGLDTALAGKAPTVHSHTTAQVTGLDTALAGKAPTVHNHTVAQVTGLQDALDGKAGVGVAYTKAEADTLLGGKAPTVHSHTTAQVAGLDAALTGKQDKITFPGSTTTFLAGDGTFRTPEGGGGGPAGVTSFNGRSGDVVPTTDDYGLAQITGLSAALAGKAATSHTHTTAQVTGLDTALAGKAAVDASYTKAEADTQLANKAEAVHTHTTAQVTGLDTALAGKAPTSHTHTTAQVTGLDTALAGKASSVHTHSMAQVDGLEEQIDFLQAADTVLSDEVAGKADTVHTHVIGDVADLETNLLARPTNSAVNAALALRDTAIAEKADATAVYTKSEMDTALAAKYSTPTGFNWEYVAGDGTIRTFSSQVALQSYAITAGQIVNTAVVPGTALVAVHVGKLQGQINDIKTRETTLPSSVTVTGVGSMCFGVTANAALAYGAGFVASSGTPLKPASVSATGVVTTSGEITSGTWRCLGNHVANQATLFIRVA